MFFQLKKDLITLVIKNPPRNLTLLAYCILSSKDFVFNFLIFVENSTK